MEPQRPLRFIAGRLSLIGTSVFLAAAVLFGALSGCREQSSAPVDRNQAPETILTGVPGDSTTTFYRIHLHWSGFDADGVVVGYEWAITDSLPRTEVEYRYTTRTDSTFIFSVDESREVLGHRFYVRAVDNEGRRDPVPAFTFFTVRNNCVPVVQYVVAEAIGPLGEVRPLASTSTPPTDSIPTGWGVRFAWTGFDCDRALLPDGQVVTVGSVVGYDYKLSPLEIDPIPAGARDTVAIYDAARLRSDSYEMQVRARDDAGLLGNDPAIRTFVWNLDPRTRFSRDLLPDQPDSVEVFYVANRDEGSFEPHVDGDTLAMRSTGISVRARVLAHDPDPPHLIVLRQIRVVRDAAYWETVVSEDGIWDSPHTQPYFTGDYKLMCRSTDGLGRDDGSPDTIVFHINRLVRFLETWTIGASNLWQRPQEGAEYPLPRPVPDGPDTIRIRFGVMDPDFAAPAQVGLEVSYYFESYPLPNGGRGQEVFQTAGWSQATLGDPGNPIGTPGNVNIQARLANPAHDLIPGEYVLHVEARERMDPNQASRYGSRIHERRVRFFLR